MNRYILSLIIFLTAFALRAQELTVASMQETMEIMTADKQRKDLNGNPCALLYIQTTLQGLEFEGNIIGEVEFRNSRYRVYLSAGSKSIRILGNSFIPAHVTFADYEISSLEGKRVYTLKVIPPRDEKADAYQNEAQKLEQLMQWCDLGNQMYQEENFSGAFEYYQRAADKGFARAQTALGLCYLTGKGVEVDHAKAINCFRLAADQNYSEGIFQLGYAYKWGISSENNNMQVLEGLKQNNKTALEYITKAAEMGNANAQFVLGDAYMRGDMELEKDLNKGREILKLSASQGHEMAINELNVGIRSDSSIFGSVFRMRQLVATKNYIQDPTKNLNK